MRLFQYITFRSAYAALTALILVLVFGKLVIMWLQRLKIGEEIRELGPLNWPGVVSENGAEAAPELAKEVAV